MTRFVPAPAPSLLSNTHQKVRQEGLSDLAHARTYSPSLPPCAASSAVLTSLTTVKARATGREGREVCSPW